MEAHGHEATSGGAPRRRRGPRGSRVLAAVALLLAGGALATTTAAADGCGAYGVPGEAEVGVTCIEDDPTTTAVPTTTATSTAVPATTTTFPVSTATTVASPEPEPEPEPIPNPGPPTSATPLRSGPRDGVSNRTRTIGEPLALTGADDARHALIGGVLLLAGMGAQQVARVARRR